MFKAIHKSKSMKALLLLALAALVFFFPGTIHRWVLSSSLSVLFMVVQQACEFAVVGLASWFIIKA